MAAWQEHWIGRNDGQSIYFLYDGSLGWGMYFSSAIDSGAGINNPGFCGDLDLEIGYRLKDGSYGFYPARWAFTFWDLDAVVACFRRYGKLPTWILLDINESDSDVFGRTSGG